MLPSWLLANIIYYWKFGNLLEIRGLALGCYVSGALAESLVWTSKNDGNDENDHSNRFWKSSWGSPPKQLQNQSFDVSD